MALVSGSVSGIARFALSLAAFLYSNGAFADAIVLRSARMLTMDSANAEATHLAIVDGKIAAVGDIAVQPFLEGATIYDLPGALVLPGFQDGHNHLIWSATQAEHVNLAGVIDEASLRQAIAPALETGPEGAWIRGWGWSVADGLQPSAGLLDRITGDRPAYFEDVDGHSGWANSAALKAAGIDADIRDPEGGRIERDERGNPNGLLRGTAMSMIGDLLPPYPESQVDTALAKAQAEAMSHGITAILDPSAEDWMLDGYHRAAAEGRLHLRVRAAVKVDAAEGVDGVGRVLGLRERHATGNLQVTSVKFFIDGVIETGTAALLQAYEGSNRQGEALFSSTELNELTIAADRAGLQLHAHAIGDRASRMALDAFEAARKVNGVRDSRHQIAHLELVDPADISRFRTLAVIANIQASWAYPDSYIVDLTMPKIGEARSRWLYPFGALKAAGARLAGGSDWSVSTMNPLEAIQTGVTRQDISDPEGTVLTPQHRLGLMDMLRAYTADAAYAVFDEANSGSLTPGKRADIVVLDRDITKGAATDIAKARVLATLIDGRLVYADEKLPPPERYGPGSEASPRQVPAD
jgi:predicted amidohydrolase YtcJ